MRIPLLCLMFAVGAAQACFAAPSASSLSFEDVPSNTILRYSFYPETYRVVFSMYFRTLDHTAATWGPPNSGSNVVAVVGMPSYYAPSILFGYSTPHSVEYDSLASVGAYFSTDVGAMVRITAYDQNIYPPGPAVASVVIGAPGQSWNNEYVQIGSPGQSFTMLKFEAVNSPNDLLGFCLDDMTITYVPEPSSLAAMGVALAGMGCGMIRRLKAEQTRGK